MRKIFILLVLLSSCTWIKSEFAYPTYGLSNQDYWYLCELRSNNKINNCWDEAAEMVIFCGERGYKCSLITIKINSILGPSKEYHAQMRLYDKYGYYHDFEVWNNEDTRIGWCGPKLYGKVIREIPYEN